MKQDIVLCGVGGQGILSVAYLLDHSAMDSGCYLKQPEVHGMAQRGGAVSAHVRVSDLPIASDLVPTGTADLVLSLEPLEALRYLEFLAGDGWLITDITPFVNIPNYPELVKLYDVLFGLPRVLAVNGGYLAKKAGTHRAQNMVVLGAAAHYLPYPAELVEWHITRLFGAKGERIVNINLNAFRMGKAAGQFFTAMLASRVDPRLVARVLPRLDFETEAVTAEVISAWQAFFRQSPSDELIRRVFAEDVALPLAEEIPAKLLQGVSPRDLVERQVGWPRHG